MDAADEEPIIGLVATDKRILAVQPGIRVKFKGNDGAIRHGTVKRIDEIHFPGVVFIDGDDGKEHQVPIGIGLPD